ncbi:phage head closure protein [Clostridium tyrobutyricum]|jgi:SPP1 family predicted phage head-tail adaptor|uniref:phage head closure protein n=1 Tax=Clostridium tyrobutyricum TaxID=1519 RepID=UPI00189F4DEB|nr:phage head closure protein [Clostridium tyrobutyricum]
MTYDYELILIQKDVDYDEVGNQIPIEKKISILCGKKSVGRTEFYNAAANNLKPEIVFEIHGYEYSGETEVEFNGKRYTVIRTYEVDFENLELTCEVKRSNG